VLTLIDLIGPLFLLFPSDPPKCLSTTEELFSVNLARVSTSLTEAEPEHVLSVWTCRPVPGAQTYSLRASTGRYLSSDRLGVVTAEKEAIGPLEEWTPLLRQDGVVWQNAYGKFLTVDEETWTLRADADTIGFQQVWRIKCQEALRRERVKAEKATKAHTEKLQEAELM
jgi:protein FRG1